MSKARRAELEVFYQGTDISDYISEDLIGFSFTDTANSIADDISINLQDIQGRWLKEWDCKTSDKIIAKIKAYDWEREGDYQEMNCGIFTVDAPEYTIKPSTISIKAVSIPSNTNFKDVPKSKNWAKASVKQIAETIAKSSGLELVYDTKFNMVITAKEQSNETNMSFLQTICSDYGLVLKIYNEKIIIFSESEYEQKPSVMTISADMVNNIVLTNTISDSGYNGVLLRCKKSKGTFIKYSFYPDRKNKTKILPLTDSVENLKEAEIVAKSKLREKNKKEFTTSFTLPGLSPVMASNCVDLDKSFGKFAGKYYVEQMTQNISPTSAGLQLHRVLNGY